MIPHTRDRTIGRSAMTEAESLTGTDERERAVQEARWRR